MFDSGEFSEAAAKFQAAYLLSNVSKIYSKFSNSLAVANIAAKAQTLLNSGKFSEAAVKFDEACKLSNIPTIKNIFLQIAKNKKKVVEDEGIFSLFDREKQESNAEVKGNPAGSTTDVLGDHSVGEVEFTKE